MSHLTTQPHKGTIFQQIYFDNGDVWNIKNIKEISVGQMVKIVTDEATIFVNMDKVNFFVEPHNVPPEKSFKSITKNKEGK